MRVLETLRTDCDKFEKMTKQELEREFQKIDSLWITK